jgi:EmrB/QacA subfamily drug resistance transporter
MLAAASEPVSTGETMTDTTVDASLDVAASFRWTPGHVIALVVLCLAALLDTIDVTVVNVAMPAIKTSLHFSESGLAWMVNAYMVPFGGFMLLGGRAGDVLGRRRILLAGTAVFTAASLGSALAPDPAVMILTRALEGTAAAFVIPMTLAMLASIFPAGAPRNRAFGVWGGVSAAAGTLGLVAGGLLVSAAGWRWIFLINIPAGAVVIAAAVRSLPADRPADRSRRFDAVGAVAATTGASLLAYGIAQTAAHPWGSGRTIGLLAGAAILLGYFLVHERFVADSPLMPLSVWRNRSVAGANVVAVVQGSSLYAMFYFTTLYLQLVLHYSALRTGLCYLPLGISILAGASASPGLVRRIGVRLTTAAGSLVGAVGLFLLARIPVNGSLLTDIVIPTVLIGIGGGMTMIPTSIAAMSGAPAKRTGLASALLNVSRQLGGALGLAAISTFAATRTAHESMAGHPVSVALTDGFRLGFTVSGAVMLAAFLAALLLLRDDGRGQSINLAELQAAG